MVSTDLRRHFNLNFCHEALCYDVRLSHLNKDDLLTTSLRVSFYEDEGCNVRRIVLTNIWKFSRWP